MEHPKFRAAFDLLPVRAKLKVGETIELAKWWHEYQFSNGEQRTVIQEQPIRLHPKPKKILPSTPS